MCVCVCVCVCVLITMCCHLQKKITCSPCFSSVYTIVWRWKNNDSWKCGYCVGGEWVLVLKREVHNNADVSKAMWMLPLFVYTATNHLESGRRGFEPYVAFCGWSHTSDLKVGILVATLTGAWCYMVSGRSCWPSVSILWLNEIASLNCNFCLSVAAHTIVWADPSLRYNSMLLRH